MTLKVHSQTPPEWYFNLKWDLEHKVCTSDLHTEVDDEGEHVGDVDCLPVFVRMSHISVDVGKD